MILAIDTVAPVVGVAALEGGRLAERAERVHRGTETLLPGWIRAVCAELGGEPADVRGVAVAVGPGAFTGLRVGIAAATGLAMALGVPVFPCSSLRSRGRALTGEGIVILDARKGRFYAARFFEGRERTPAADLEPSAVLAGLSAGFLATGEGAIVLRERIEAAGGRVVAGADDPAVGHLAELAAAAFAAGEGRDPLTIAPLYLREPDAVPTAERGRSHPGKDAWT